MKWLFRAIVMILCLTLVLSAVGCSNSATKDTTPPSTPAGITKTTPGNDNTPTFTWDAATDDASGIDYYLVNVDSGDWVNIGNVTAYMLNTALSDGGHTFKAKAVDKAGNKGSEGSCTFTIDTTPPAISSVSASGMTTSSAVVTWTTNESATSQVEYGITSGYGSSSVLDSSLVTTHTMNLTGLTAGTTYHYRVKSKDAGGNEASSDDKTFDTVQSTPAIGILSHSSYLDSIGYYHVVGEVKNNSSNKLTFVEVTVTFYNSAGTVVGTDFTFTSVDTLLPNQKSPFEIIEIDAAISAQVDHYSLAVSDFNITGTEPYRGFTILSHSSSKDILGYYHVVGEVKNTGTQAATYVQVVGTFYDTTGKVVAADFTFTNPSDLAAGQVAPFEIIVVSDTLSDKISSYELQVQS